MKVVEPGFHNRVFEVVSRVPAGRVTTYGDVAEALGARSVARHVGFALAAVPDGSGVPWHRVVNARGRVSLRSDGAPSLAQIQRLKLDGVDVDAAGRIENFGSLRWQPGRVTG